MLFGFLMLFATGSASSNVSQEIDQEARSELSAAGVPKDVTERVLKGGKIPDSIMQSLTSEQQQAIETTRLKISGGKIGAGAGVAIAGGFSLVVIVMSFVGGLLGWLLVMKKKVLQCTTCETVIAAS